VEHPAQCQNSRIKIDDLTARLSQHLESEAINNIFLSLRNHVSRDVVQNRGRPKNGPRRSLETLQWAWPIHELSPSAWELVQKGFDLRCERLLRTHFAATGHVLSAALVDLQCVGELVVRWNNSSPETQNDRRVVLLVDAVSFRPGVTIASDGSVGGLEDIAQLESPDLFEQYLRNPKESTAFLAKHWSQAYSALFAFQIQPILPSMPCFTVHAWPHCNRMGCRKSLTVLFDLSEILERQFRFQVVALAFDVGSICNDLHRSFKEEHESACP
jgi:hypothetical protein